MDRVLKILFCFAIGLGGNYLLAQNSNVMYVELLPEKKVLTVHQEIVFENSSKDSLGSIILNDWNNAFSTKNTPLAKRFSDEFIRSFHLAKPDERGSTSNITLLDENKSFLDWCRPERHPDLIAVSLKKKLDPGQ
ncbi:MAG: aminopeptidase, partial [Flavobacterium sp.]|nr:aminopeptidase [Flavobacterium sp.]